MTTEFAKDFISLQAEITTMPKDKSGYGYKYTDLDTIISNIKPLLKKHNIAFTQVLESKLNDGNVITGVTTTVIHASGDSFTGFVSIPDIQVGKANNAQNIGAAITYFKRYALAAAFGISSDEDIDCSSQKLDEYKATGNSAPKGKSQTAPTVKAQPNNKSDNTNKNLTPKALPQLKLYTEEEAKQLGEVMNAVLKMVLLYFLKKKRKCLKNVL